MREGAPDNLSPFPNQRILMPYLERMSDVVPQRIRWLSRGRLAFGKITILDGDPGLGKSTLMLEWAARITRGEALPDGEPGRPRSVIILSAEDDTNDTILPRLIAAGADLSRVFVFWMRDEEGGTYLGSIPFDLAALMSQVEATDAALIIIDPFMAFLSGDVKSNNDQDVRRALSPLSTGLAKAEAACLISRHLNKAVGLASLYRGGGSIGIIGAARFGLLVAKDPDDESGLRRILAVQKCNIGPEAESLAYHLESVTGTDVARVVWEGESRHRAHALTDNPRAQSERAGSDRAWSWLADVLSRGPVLQRDIRKMVEEEDFSWRTVTEVKARMGVISTRDKFGPGSSVSWSLPRVTVGGHTTQPYNAHSARHSGQAKNGISMLDLHTSHSEPNEFGNTQNFATAADLETDDPFAEDEEE